MSDEVIKDDDEPVDVGSLEPGEAAPAEDEDVDAGDMEPGEVAPLDVDRTSDEKPRKPQTHISQMGEEVRTYHLRNDGEWVPSTVKAQIAEDADNPEKAQIDGKIVANPSRDDVDADDADLSEPDPDVEDLPEVGQDDELPADEDPDAPEEDSEE